jgi:hypothetical protein
MKLVKVRLLSVFISAFSAASAAMPKQSRTKKEDAVSRQHPPNSTPAKTHEAGALKKTGQSAA